MLDTVETVSANLDGKYCLLTTPKLVDIPGTVPVATPKVFSTLPNNLTELLNCFWSGPTSDKSLGILFILSFNNVICEVTPTSKSFVIGYDVIAPGRYTL